MSSPVRESPQNISNLLAIDEEYASPAIIAQTCRQKNWAEEHRRSIEDPQAFWGDYARNFVWSRPWRSEERRVGKECRSGGWRDESKENREIVGVDIYRMKAWR